MGPGVTNPPACGIDEGGNWAFFLNCGRCFSRARNMPSLVNGFGKTSFMPIITLGKIEGSSQEKTDHIGSTYRCRPLLYSKSWQ